MTEFLYHYTTISNLALILKNRTLRLNSLNRVEDLQEAKSLEMMRFQKSIILGQAEQPFPYIDLHLSV